MTCVIVGYLDTPEGNAALHAASQEAKARSAQLIVVHSSRGGVTLDGGDAVALKSALTEVKDDLDAHGVPFHIRNLVRGKEPAEDLLEMVEEYGADLIVLGNPQRSPVGKLILGSQLQRVLMHAKCPVLAVRADHG
jgi:nucleotide-binding universal stress UspA family protein